MGLRHLLSQFQSAPSENVTYEVGPLVSTIHRENMQGVREFIARE